MFSAVFVLFYLFLFCLFISFYFLFLDVFSISVSDVLMNLIPWTAFYNTELQPPSTSNP